MKRWIEGWLIPLVEKYADTPAKKRVVYTALAVLGLVLGWMGVSLSQISVDQMAIVDQTPIGEGRLK